jgi:hypothetical protein
VQISLVALLVFGALMAPWLARNYQISGHFFGIASYAVYQETGAFPGTRMERYLTGDFEEALSKVDFYVLMRKFLTNVPGVLQEELPRVGGSWVTAFFLAGLLVPFRNVALGRLRIFALLSLGLFVVVQALGKTHLSAASPEVNSENLLILAAPLVFMFGVALFITLLDQVEIPLPPLRSLVVGIFVLVVSAPLLFALMPPRSIPFAYPPIYWPPLVQQVGQFFSEDELMMSDMPWAVAWYGNRQCIWATLNAPGDPQFKRTREEQPVFQMPASISKEKERERIEQLRSDFYVIYDYHKPIHGIYLTRLTTDAQFYSEMVRNPDHAWGRFMLDALLKTNVPSGFPLRHATPGFLEEGQLLLMDRRRW